MKRRKLCAVEMTNTLYGIGLSPFILVMETTLKTLNDHIIKWMIL